MTKDEMLKEYSILDSENNYKEAQRRIAEAMKRGEKYTENLKMIKQKILRLFSDVLPCYLIMKPIMVL